MIIHNGSMEINLNDFIAFLNTKTPNTTYSFKAGSKFIKIISEYYGSRSVYCFVDRSGNIYKAASWKAPAKHIRGSLFDQEYSYGKGLGQYGASYLR